MSIEKSGTNIPGIYNYCDRWCERCAFTARCSVFARTAHDGPGQTDAENDAFWKGLSENFAETIHLLHKAAEERGIALNEPSEEEIEEMGEEQKAQDAASDQHPMIVAAFTYLKEATALLKKEDWTREKAASLQQEVVLGIRSLDATKDELRTLIDCFEVVRWYLQQIYVKLKRALFSQEDEAADDDPMLSDANGSAKVALIGADRSMAAWQRIMQALPQAEDDILGLLALLQKLRALAEQQFPHARAFRRPGFDD